ncbi:hypothetical protein EDB86DRAFT_2992017 [Lactarius hatsudake]|nr:hypothetical protein EDB86DRAFT_2992017 [Lactarius hatsudake]
MSSPPPLSLSQSPSASIPDLAHGHDPPPLSATSAPPRPSAQSEAAAAEFHQDINTTIPGVGDVVDRLLPYHVFQHPREDLLMANKGKRRATETEILQSELAETKLALECFKRRSALEERFRRARTKSGKRTAASRPLRVEHGIAHSKSRARAYHASAAFDRPPATYNYYLSAAPVYAHHYRAYHYPYAQTYGVPASTSTSTPGYPYSVPLNSTVQYVPPPLTTSATTTKTLPIATNPAGAPASTSPAPSSSMPATCTAASAPTGSPAGTSNVSSAIPVQLPVSSLSTLHDLGIVPVPTQSVSADAPTPPAINVSLLQAAQMSGLALMLNSIMLGSSNSGTTEVPPHAQVGAPYTYPYAAAQSLATATIATTSVNAGLNKTNQPQEQEKLE